MNGIDPSSSFRQKAELRFMPILFLTTESQQAAKSRGGTPALRAGSSNLPRRIRCSTPSWSCAELADMGESSRSWKRIALLSRNGSGRFAAVYLGDTLLLTSFEGFGFSHSMGDALGAACSRSWLLSSSITCSIARHHDAIYGVELP